MIIPEASYQNGIWEVSEKEKYDALEAARAYHANRSVCIAKQRKLPIFRFCFLVMLMPLFGYFFTEFWQKDLSNYMAVIALCYTVAALPFVLFLKDLRIPAIGSLAFCAEAFRLDDWTALIPTLVPIVILGAIAYFHERDKRWIGEQPGFPDFHDIEVRVREERTRTDRDVPLASEPAEDPYSDVLGSLQ